ncbi:MAG: type VI secretion system tip protein VgrG [Candidatus Methylumidiphilus sp.]
MADDNLIPTPAPADLPTFKIKAAGVEVTGEYQIKAIVVSREFNRVASAEIMIHDGDPAAETFKVSESEDFVPGNDLEITAGYHGNEQTIFKGIVVRHGLRAPNSGRSFLRVECKDKAVRLTVGRKSAYFYDEKDSGIIEQLAQGAGLQADVAATQVTHPQMVQCQAADWDFLVTRAEANGLLVLTQDGKLVAKAPDASKPPVLALTYGRNVLDFEAVMDSRDEFASIHASAWNPADQAVLDIEGADPSATAPGNLSADDLAAVIGLDPLMLQHAGQIKDSELQAWADGKRLKSGYSKVRGRVRIQGYAAVAPGDVIELGGMGGRFNGKALVSGVRHEINVKNWETDIAFGLSPDWFGLTQPRVSDAPAAGLLPGVSGLHVALVTALEGDPDGEDRIQVRVPMMGVKDEGIWARVATLDAGKERGSFFRPEIDDEVVLGYLNEDPRNPIVLGMLNSSKKPAPLQAADANPQKGFVTRAKMKLLFDDEKKTITVETPGGNSILLSDEDGAITVKDQNGNKLVLDSKGVTIESAKDVSINASSGDIKLAGLNVKASADAQLEAKGTAGAELSSGGSTVVKGSIVQIN